MTVTTISSRAFSQDAGAAKKAAGKGPVFITDRGRPAHVLLTMEDYQKLIGRRGSIIDMLGEPPGVEDAELETPRPRDPARPANLR